MEMQLINTTDKLITLKNLEYYHKSLMDYLKNPRLVATNICPQCGAIVSENKCDYCGAKLKLVVDKE